MSDKHSFPKDHDLDPWTLEWCEFQQNSSVETDWFAAPLL